METYKFTHKGWLLFAPIYIGELESDSPVVSSRFGLGTDLLLDLAFLVVKFIVTPFQKYILRKPVCVNLRVTGELEENIYGDL